MDNAFLSEPRRTRLWALVAVAAVALVLAAAVVLTRGGGHDTAKPVPAGVAVTVDAVATVPPSPAQTTGVAVSAPALKLVDGTHRVNGVAVGYPLSRAGAISAAVEYATQFGSNLDPQRAAAIAQAAADRQTGRSPTSFAQDSMDSRRRLGLDVSGSIPTGASISFGPVSYQVRDIGPDHATVLLLGYLTTITPKQGLRNAVIAVPVPVIWSGGDWKLTERPADAPDYAGLRFAPGSAEAVAAGWLPLTA